MKLLCATLLSLFSLTALSAPTSAQSLAVRGARVYTVANGVIENGVVLVEGGKITRVGQGIEIPRGVTVVEAAAVIPGIVDMHTHVGVYSVPMVDENSDGNEMTNPITPAVRAFDSFNWDDPAIAAGRAGGVTTVISRPGSGNIIGGTSVAVKLKDAPPSEMVLREIADLKMAIEGNPVGVYGARNQMPSTLMGVYHLAEKAFIEAQEYAASWEKYESELEDNGDDPTPPARDLGKEALLMAMRQEILFFFQQETAYEIMSEIRLADEFNLNLSLCHSYWVHLLVDALADRKEELHINIGPPMFFSYFDDALTFKNNPAIMANAGYRVSLQTDALGGGQQNLRHLAMLTVRYGMDEDDALRAITLAPAEAMDLEERIGSIEVGKDADLVLLDGEPFDMLAEVQTVVIDGNVEFEREMTPKPDLSSFTVADRSIAIPSDINESSRIAVRGGTVFTMTGDPIEGGTVLIEGGKITRVGAGVPVPRGYTVIDAEGFVVMPGLVSPRSHVGIGSNWRRQSHIDETSKPVVPAMEVIHAVEPHAPQFSHARELGVTTALVTPGDRNVIGGQGSILKMSGVVVDEMIVSKNATMVFGFGRSSKRENKAPMTRMGVAALLRETLVKAQEYMRKVDAHDEDDDPLKRVLDMEALLPVLRGETPVLVHAERRDDIYTALRIADEFGLEIILDGAVDAYKLVDEIKSREIPVIIENLFRGIGAIEDEGFNPRMPALLSEAGVRIAFRPNINSGWYTPGSASPGGDMLEIAAFAVKNGMDMNAALRSVTIDAARIIGVDERVGSIERGKDADLLILRGHPLQTLAVPEAVLVDGELVYKRDPMARLRLTPGMQR